MIVILFNLEFLKWQLSKISFFGIDNLPYYACSYHIMEQISNRRNEHEYVIQFENRREKNLTKHDNKHPHNFKNEVLYCFSCRKERNHMKQKDTIIKNYMSNPEYFADAFNYYLFDGEQIVRPEKLVEKDNSELKLIPLFMTDSNDNDPDETTQELPDLLKQCVLKKDEQATYFLLNISHQSDIIYIIPVISRIYDALNYQLQQIQNKTMQQKLKPVVTLAIYWSSKKWDGPLNLSDIFGEIDKTILEFITDNPINLIVPKEIKDFAKFRSDLGKVLKYLSIADQKEQYQKLSQDNNFHTLHTESAKVLKACVDFNI